MLRRMNREDSESAELMPRSERSSKAVVTWLFGVAILVFIMVIVGGITRLTESGLSITEWKLVTGVVPPMSEEVWQQEFEKYKQIPEYKEVSGPAGITLKEFKWIYFWEWIHRFLGRLVGLAFFVPLVWFWVKKMIPQGFHWRLLGLLVLGGSQGVVGWWMVASGLVERTDVSHYRLAVHLNLAFLILAALVWTALDIQASRPNEVVKVRPTGFGVAALLILGLELVLGAFTAGLNAGYVSNTWPLMYGHVVPPGIEWSWDFLKTTPEHPILIHFLHRWWAWVVVVALVVLARRVPREHRLAAVLLYAVVGAQVLLGIMTVLTGVHIVMAVLHQAVAALVLTATVWCVHLAGRRTMGESLPLDAKRE